MQPVEVVRLLVVFALAAYFARRWQFLREFSADLGPSTSLRASPSTLLRAGRWIRLPRWKDVRPLFVSISALLALFFLQRDLGPALVLSCVFLGLYGISRARVALVVAGFAVLATGFAVGYVLGVPSTVTRRVAIALDPWENALPGGDQISHALWALASGGPWGLGPGVGDPQLIPAGHTDLVMAALGEELGYIGFATVAVLFAILVWRLLRIAVRAPGDYTAFLTIGLTLALAVQGLVIVAGMLGLLPLAGVVTPFLSYGRSAMLSNFAALGVCAAIARRRGPAREAFAPPVRVLGWALTVAAGRSSSCAQPTCRSSTPTPSRPAPTSRSRRTAAIATSTTRVWPAPLVGLCGARSSTGTACRSRAAARKRSRSLPLQYQKLGLDLPDTCRSGAGRERCYPLGSLAFHVLGDATRQTNWAARNTSYVEKDFDARLKGFDDRPQTVDVTNPRTGTTHAVVRRDYSELLPLVRHKGNPGHADVRRILARERNLRVTIDAGLQARTARALRDHAGRVRSSHGAAVVIDPATGDLLASASYPWPDASELAGKRPIPPDALLDRARYGLYPPGSTFKLVTAVAALRTEAAVQQSEFQCVRLPDGRVGGRVRGASRPVRDDPLDHTPHGTVDLHRGLVVSCNAYFSNLANLIGPQVLSEVASEAQIAAARAPAAQNLRATLPYAGYGQGDVLASPLRMAGVAGALAAGGMLREVRVTADRPARSAGTQWITSQGAAHLRTYMREVVTSGTGRVLAAHPVAIAGKTGTAEVDDEPSHSWFVGFAPFTGTRRIAFAVIVEHAGYGARVAAPVAGDIVSAAHALRAPPMNDFLTRVDGALRSAVQRVQLWFDPPLDGEAKPLEIREAIIEDIEQRVESAGAGRRVLPYNRVTVTVLAADKPSRARLQAALAGLQESVAARLSEIRCAIPAGFAVETRYVTRPAPAWAPDQRLAFDYHVREASSRPHDSAGGAAAPADHDRARPGDASDVHLRRVARPHRAQRATVRRPWPPAHQPGRVPGGRRRSQPHRRTRARLHPLRQRAPRVPGVRRWQPQRDAGDARRRALRGHAAGSCRCHAAIG